MPTVTAATIITAASVVATTGAIVGAVGIGLTIAGAITKKESLLKVGKIAGIAGGAMTLTGLGVGGAASAFSSSGALAAQSPTITAETAAGALTDSGIETAAAELASAGEGFTATEALNMTAVEAASGGADFSALGSAGPGITAPSAATGVATSGTLVPPGGDLQTYGGSTASLPVPSVGQGGSEPVGTTLANTNQSLGLPAPGGGGTGSGTTQVPTVFGPANAQTQFDPQSVDLSPFTSTTSTPTTNSQGPLGNLSASDKALLISGGIQGVGGALGGWFEGLSQSDQTELQREIQDARIKRGNFAPHYSFQSAPPIPQRGRQTPSPQPIGLLNRRGTV